MPVNAVPSWVPRRLLAKRHSGSFGERIRVATRVGRVATGHKVRRAPPVHGADGGWSSYEGTFDEVRPD